jgi:hypothetical protein
MEKMTIDAFVWDNTAISANIQAPALPRQKAGLKGSRPKNIQKIFSKGIDILSYIS